MSELLVLLRKCSHINNFTFFPLLWSANYDFSWIFVNQFDLKASKKNYFFFFFLLELWRIQNRTHKFVTRGVEKLIVFMNHTDCEKRVQKIRQLDVGNYRSAGMESQRGHAVEKSPVRFNGYWIILTTTMNGETQGVRLVLYFSPIVSGTRTKTITIKKKNHQQVRHHSVEISFT